PQAVSCQSVRIWQVRLECSGSRILQAQAETAETALPAESGFYFRDMAEVILGSIIKKKGWRAETERGLSRKHIIEGLKGSLQRLQLEYVDVVFANRPDSNTPMEEIVRAMTHVINQGMAMYWGTSRWSAMEIMEAYSVARQFNMIPPVCEQAEYHLFQREKVEVQLPELYHKIGVGAMTWSPLACGIISGKYGNGVPESSRASLKVFSSTSRKESGHGNGGEKETEQKSPAAACGFLAQAECGLSLAGVPWHSPSPLEVPASAFIEASLTISIKESPKCYQWLKERIVSEEGRKQQNKLKDLSPIAERLGCTLPQLAVGESPRREALLGHRE
ncbi:hypothetical protein Celaphus_00013066, partial [Cervus elaphus hippelaphus]